MQAEIPEPWKTHGHCCWSRIGCLSADDHGEEWNWWQRRESVLRKEIISGGWDYFKFESFPLTHNFPSFKNLSPSLTLPLLHLGWGVGGVACHNGGQRKSQLLVLLSSLVCGRVSCSLSGTPTSSRLPPSLCRSAEVADAVTDVYHCVWLSVCSGHHRNACLYSRCFIPEPSSQPRKFSSFSNSNILHSCTQAFFGL